MDQNRTTAEQEKRMLDQFAQLTEIDRESFDERKAADYLKEVFAGEGISLQEDHSAEKTGSNAGNLYGIFPSTEEGAEPVLLCAHMDTVKPGKGKKAIFQEDGRITGNGKAVLGADDGTSISCILEAIREIKEEGKPHRLVELLFTTAEEAYTVGASAFDVRRIKSKRAYAADIDNVMGCYSMQEPTLLSFRVEVNGRSAHAGFEPEKGIHSLLAASRAIARLPEGRVEGDTTFNIGLIHGGTATNAIPEDTVLEGEIRSAVHEKALAFYEEMKHVFEEEALKIGAKASVEKTVHLTAYHVPEDSKALLAYKKVLGDLGIGLIPYPCFGGSDINVLRRNGIDGLCIGSSMHFAHTTREYAEKEEMMQLKEIFKELMLLS